MESIVPLIGIVCMVAICKPIMEGIFETILAGLSKSGYSLSFAENIKSDNVCRKKNV